MTQSLPSQMISNVKGKYNEVGHDDTLQSYEVKYENYYEPYVIMSAKSFIPYDERFRGYGLNKCVHIRSLADQGLSFHVLCNHFVIACCHQKSSAHHMTYGKNSGYRKYIIAAVYDRVVSELKYNLMPQISQSTRKCLFQENE